MKPNKIYKRSSIVAMALAAVFALAAAWPCASSAAGPEECTLVGTWYGEADWQLKWLGVHTAGSTPTKGEMLMDWHRVSPNLIPSGMSLTPGRGVWEMITRNQYNYTWYAYVKSTEPTPIYSVRVRGVATLIDCDFVVIDFTYEVFNGFLRPWEMSGINPVAVITSEEDGPAFEKRIPVGTVVTPPPTP